MNSSTLLSTAAVFVCVQQLSAQCGVNEGLCWTPHEGPGCSVVDCCLTVCNDYPSCCETAWDKSCALLAIDVCDWVMCGNPGSCLDERGTPGCETLDCCRFVCPLDASCCFLAWDAFCVETASRLCDVPMCAIEIPTEAIAEDEPCYKRLNDGCNIAGFPMIDVEFPALRTGKHSSGSPRDTDWYRFTLVRPTAVTVTLTAEFPGQVVFVEGPCLGPTVVRGEIVSLPCETATTTIELPAGTYACLVSAANPSRVLRSAFTCDEIDPDNPPDPKEPLPPPSPYGLRYVVSLGVANELFGDLDGDGEVGPADLAVLLGAWGQTSGGGGSVLGDLDGDGVVGSPDLALLLGAWSS